MCEKELLVAYLYEDLSGADRAAFEAHLRECAECRALAAEPPGLSLYAGPAQAEWWSVPERASA